MEMRTLKLRVWRQQRGHKEGKWGEYQVEVHDDMSFLEALDILNEALVARNEDPIAFDYDCREGICGSCGLMVEGVPHGPEPGMTICQVHMRHLAGRSILTVEPWRLGAFPIIKDLVVDRSAFDQIMAAGGYVSTNVGAAPEANATPIPHDDAELAFDYAACIGCGACAAACRNAAPHLFVGAKVAQLALMPQGHPERTTRVKRMVETMQRLGFGTCSNDGECEAVCPKAIKTAAIGTLNREYLRATLKSL